ncbi:MAG: glycosyltransferase family 2 protein [Rhodospirillaceae bacterium]|nr:MAG: glycosyltransferase family 2 protein [Rhodospirillaceae bacterium]
MALRSPLTATVVIPAYNAAKTLDRTLESAVASLRHCVDVAGLALDCEIVVVDDVSTDATAGIAEAWAKREPAVRLIRNAVNRGPGFSRNEGVRQSTGWFLFFLDADDVFYPNHIHLCVKELLADSALGYVFTRMKVDMPMHADWGPSLDESNPINFCVRRVWHDMIQGFAEEADFRTYRTEDTLYRKCLRDLVKHRKIDVITCEQFISPGNALDRQRAKLGMSMAEWNRSGLDDGFFMTPQMETVVKARLAHVAKLLGAKV